MEIFGLAVGMFLPWVLGVVWLRVRWLKAEEVNWPTLLGYGYLAGALATGMVMRLLDLVGIRLGFATIGGTLIALIVAGIWAGRDSVLRKPNVGADWRELVGGWQQACYVALLVLIIIRLVGLGFEVVWRPLFPWDAWSQWATKTRVWYELGHLAPFVHRDVWLADSIPGAYTDFAPHYPPAVPLLQVWVSYSLGRWDDALMNLPWLQCALGLGLAFYGQARRWQATPLFAMMFTYFLLSLPILETHVALAGYADLFMAATFCLAAMAFFHWIRWREHWQGIVALLFVLSCAFVKQPGVMWMLAFIPAFWVAVAPRSAGVCIFAITGLATLWFFVLAPAGKVNLFGYDLPEMKYASAWEPLWQNLMWLDNWHLLWYLAIGGGFLSLPRLFSRLLRGMTTLALAGIAFLAVVFLFTKAQIWAEDFTTLNRAFLHLAPMISFYIMVLCLEAAPLISVEVRGGND